MTFKEASEYFPKPLLKKDQIVRSFSKIMAEKITDR